MRQKSTRESNETVELWLKYLCIWPGTLPTKYYDQNRDFLSMTKYYFYTYYSI